MNQKLILNRLVAIMLLSQACFCGGTACAQSLRMVPETGHTGVVRCVVFSPDGQLLVSGSPDKTVRIWSRRTGQELHELANHAGMVCSVAFSPDSRLLASWSTESILIWDCWTGKEVRKISGHSQFLSSVAFSPDGRLLASGQDGNIVRIWDAATGKEIRSLIGHTESVRSVAFSPDGLSLASGSGDKTVRLWDVRTGLPLAVLRGHTKYISSIAFSPDGLTLASGSWDRSIRLWNINSKAETCEFIGHTDLVNAVAFAPDGRTLVSGGSDCTIRFWDVHTGKESSRITGNLGAVESVAYSPDNANVVTGSSDRSIRLWDVHSTKEICTYGGHAAYINSVAMAPHDHILANAGGAKSIQLLNLESGREIVEMKGHSDDVESVAFSPNEKTLASGSQDHTARLWDVSTGRELQKFVGHTDAVHSVAFSPDGKTLATGSYDHTIRIWDLLSGKTLRVLTGHTYFVLAVAFSADGRTLVSASSDGTARLWDVETGHELSKLTGLNPGASMVAFSPDNHVVAISSFNGSIRLWIPATSKENHRLEGHDNWVFSVAFSPAGDVLASGSFDNTVRLWDPAAGKELRELRGHTSGVSVVAFSDDGLKLVSGSIDGSIRVWSVSDGQCLYTRYGFDDGSWIAVAPDGRYDSSDGAHPHFGHFVMDLPGEISEVVGFDQVRTKDYYEPDLVAKIMNGTYKPGEQPLLSQKPAPRVDQKLNGNLVKFRVTERFGGGVGDVRISVNSQTVKTFLKGEVSSGVSITWDGTGFVMPGAAVEVVADNGLETLTSARAVSATADLPPSKEPIRFVGLAMGVKSYLGGVKPLKFAGADSVAMARAMLTLAKSLGTGVTPEIYLLTDEEVPADLKGLVTVLPPTKASYTSAVAKIKGTKFTSNTLLFLDFSGHGVMLGDEYLYLTKDARTADPLQLKNQMECGITMPEILKLLNLCLAGKRLLVLDTCQAAGVEKLLASNLKEGEAELDAQKRTIADWQNRYAVGTQVLMGCPEGASSYEDPRYGHGLLTYSLLYCLQNNDLGDKPGDPEVLANKLVEQSAEQTKAIAAQLGFNQFAQPLGAHAFPIGLMKREDRQKAIVLPNPKPAIGSCSLTDENDFPADAFNQAFVAELESSSKGSSIVHVTSQQAPGVWIVTGKYLKSVDGHITLKLNLSQGTRHEKLPEITTTETQAVGDAYKSIAKWLESSQAKTVR